MAKRSTVVLCIVLAAVLLIAVNPGNISAANKVTVCHKGVTITIAEKALSAHLAHGDYEGSCSIASTSPESCLEQCAEERLAGLNLCATLPGCQWSGTYVSCFGSPEGGMCLSSVYLAHFECESACGLY